MDIAAGSAIAANHEDAVNAVVPPSSTKDEDAYVSALVAFEGVYVAPGLRSTAGDIFGM